MESQINKLLEEYARKIKNCDRLITHSLSRKQTARKAGNTDIVQYEQKEQSILNAQKQAYIQAASDIDSLLDYVEPHKEQLKIPHIE